MKNSTREALNDHADQCAIGSDDAFKLFHDRLRAENRADAPDLTDDQREDNALYFALQDMTVTAVRY